MADATWRCSSCDTYNDVNTGKCQVCDEPHTGRRPQAGNGPARKAGATWQCRHCDVWNDTALKSCQGCEMSRLDATRVMGGTDTPTEARPRHRSPRDGGPSTPAPRPRPRTFERPVADAAPPPVAGGFGGGGFGGGGFEMPAPFEAPRPIFFSPKDGLPMGAPAKRKTPGALIGFLAALVVGFIVLLTVLGAHGGSGSSAGSDGALTPNSGTEQSPDSSSPADATSDSGQEQAQSIDGLLDKAGSTRSSLPDAIDEVSGCSDVDSGVSALQGIVSDRESQVSEAQDLQVDALDGGDELKDKLVSALSDSLSADREYLSWARSAQDDGCDGTAPLTADYDAGNDDSAKAGKAKTAFIDLWTPVASQYELTSRDDDDI